MTERRIPDSHPTMGKSSLRWVYRDGNGEALCAVYRFDLSGGKAYLPYDICGGVWKAPDPRPLYGLERLVSTPGCVVMVEGEKCADVLNRLGVLAVSCFGGANASHKNDLSPLTGRDVVIWPDADDAGQAYALKLSELLDGIAASVSVLPFKPNVPLNHSGFELPDPFKDMVPSKGWDVADAVDEGWDALVIGNVIGAAVPLAKGTLPIAIGEMATDDVYGLAKDTLPKDCGLPSLRNVTLRKDSKSPSIRNVTKDDWPEPDMSVLNSEPLRPSFPYELLGPNWGQWAKDAAEAVSAPVDYVGATLLTTASSLIGTSRWASPWEGWKEPAVLWTALIGSPSSNKSPAMDPAMDLIRELEKDFQPDYEDALHQWETDKMAAKLVRDKWEQESKQAVKEGVPIPHMPEAADAPLKPERTRLKVSDVTPEALGMLLASQPKGTLFYRDELAGWLGNFDRYGGKGGDRAFWIEAFGGRSYTVERVKHDGKPIQIDHLAVSVLGGIQPDRFESLMKSGDDDGLTARFLYVWPKRIPPKRPDCLPNRGAALRAFRKLSSLTLTGNDPVNGDGEHVTLTLTSDAADLFQNWREQHAENEPEGRYASWWGKCPGMVLRVALILQHLWWSAENDYAQLEQISLSALDASLRLMENYLKPMAQLVYYGNAESLETVHAANLAREILKRKPQTINARDVYRNWNVPGLCDAESVHNAIEVMIEADWLSMDEATSGPQGGRRRGDYVVSPCLCQN